MNGLRFNCSGPDAILLARILVLFKGLFAMDLFKSLPNNLPSQALLQQLYDRYEQAYEGGKFGDRKQIALRKRARLELVENCRKVVHFLEAVAGDDDLIPMQNAGIEMRKTARKKIPKKVPATAEGTGGNG